MSGQNGKDGRELTLPTYMTKKKKATSARQSAGGAASTNKTAKGTSGTAREAASQSKKPSSGSAAKKTEKKTVKKSKAPALKKPRLSRFGRVAVGLILAIIAVLVLIAALRGGKTETASEQNVLESEQTYMEGVRVEGVDIGGMTPAEAAEALQSAAVAKINTTEVTLRSEDELIELTGEDMGLRAPMTAVLAEAMNYGRIGTVEEKAEALNTLKNGGRDFYITLSADSVRLATALSMYSAKFYRDAVEPHAIPHFDPETRSQSFEFFEGVEGRSLNIEATADKISSHFASGGTGGEIEPVIYTEQCALTLDYIKENTQRISTYSTRFRKSSSDDIIKNRVFNIEKAAEIINCTVVMPDDEWSFNDTVGPRTEELGWKNAKGISGGKEYTLQAGGGICQVSTTLYNALLCANIEVTDRRAHSIPSDYVAKGLDATVDTNGIDFKFKNDTGAPVYVFAYTKPDEESGRYMHMVISLYGKALDAGVTYLPRSVITETIPQEDTVFTDDETIPAGYQFIKVAPHDGFVAEAYLDKYVNGEVEQSTLMYTDKYRGNPAEILIGTGDPEKVEPIEGATLIGAGEEE